MPKRRITSSGHCLILLLAALAMPAMNTPSCHRDTQKDRTVYTELEAPVGSPPPQTTSAPTASAPAARGELVASGSATCPASAPATSTPVYSATQLAAPQEVVACSIMQVNDKFITLQQVFHPIRKQLKAAAAISTSEEEFRQRCGDLLARQVREQIEQEVLFAEAMKRLTEEEKKLVQEQIDDHARHAVAQAGGKTLFEEQLKKEGTDYSSWVQDMNRTIMVEAFIHQRFRSRVNIDRIAMLKYYNENLPKYHRGQQLQMQVISAPFMSFMSATQPDSMETRRQAVGEAHRHIMAALEALHSGQDFAEVAKKFDRGPRDIAEKGGVRPMMDRGDFKASEVEDAAIKQPVGKTSDVIESVYGFYIVKTLAVQGGDTQTFDKVQKEIESELRRQQYKTLTVDYLKELQKQTLVRGSDDAAKLAIDAAVKQFWNK